MHPVYSHVSICILIHCMRHIFMYTGPPAVVSKEGRYGLAGLLDVIRMTDKVEMYVYVCICAYIYVYIDMTVYIYIYICICIYIHTHVYADTYTHSHLYIYIYTGFEHISLGIWFNHLRLEFEFFRHLIFVL
jgi:hypothetical protein